ncbi:Putative ribonuclease H protein At1g65750 [Linum perenne]
MIQTPWSAEWANLRVCDLWMLETREWDVELLEHVFEQADVEAIISTTTLVGRGADEIIWTADKQGEYSVKSGYKVYMNRCVNRLALNRSGDWSRIWQLKLPPKIRHFAWRLARQVIPVRAELRRRHYDVPEECGVCGMVVEDFCHLFGECSFVEDCSREAASGSSRPRKQLNS